MSHTPWVIIGDFIVILFSNEKIGGLSHGKRCPYFGEFVETTDLYDLGFRGPPYTWHRGNLFERLDCALSNESYVKSFPKSLITIPKIKFDHRPLLLNLKLEISYLKEGPFSSWWVGLNILNLEIL